MKKGIRFRTLMVMSVLLLAAATAGSALAHERRPIGDYELVVGFMVEPAYEGEKNGVDLRVTRGAEPVEGLADTLQVEITYNPSGTSQTMPLQAVFGQPGRYTAHLIPTRPGAYSMRFFGTIEGQEVDELFVPRSMGGGYNDVETASDIHFPERLPAIRELEAAVRGAQAAAQEAQAAAISANNGSNTNTLGIVGVALGALGAGAGLAALAMVARKR